MKLYIDMEPQPEILVKSIGKTYMEERTYVELRCSEPMLISPYKTGDEIWVLNGTIVQQSDIEETRKHDGEPEKSIVKSCTPIQRDGRWKWEIEVES